MADDDDDDDLEPDEEDLEGEEGEEGEGGGDTGRKRLLIVIAAVVLLILGGATAAYFFGLLDPLIKTMSGGDSQQQSEDQMDSGPVVAGDVVFFDVPEILVTLNTAGRKQAILRIVVSLELENANDVAAVEAMMPRVVDSFQVYLRELRVEDLKGSAGMYRLREELLKRVNVAVAPAVISDVLFKEMMVQ